MTNYPSVERSLVAWAKTYTPITTITTSTRISTRLPESPTFPYLTVRRIGGGPVEATVPIDLPLVQWDCYGQRANRDTPTPKLSPDYTSAENLALAIMSAAEDETQIIAEGFVYGMQLLSMQRVTEEETMWAHYAVDMFVTVRENL
jgi:hypothetical protein